MTDDGKIVTCISNIFCGVTLKKVKLKLEKFCSLGLRHLSLNYYDFYSKYIKIEFIENILDAVVQLSIQIKLNMTVNKENDVILKIVEIDKDIPNGAVVK